MAHLESSYHAFGLDIGDRSIKAAEIVINRFVLGPPRMELRAWNEVEVPEGVFSPGRVEKPEAAAKLLKSVVNLATPKAIKTRSVIVSFPETTTFVKTVEIPKVDPESIGAEIEREAAEHIPLPLSEATLDWQLLLPLDESVPRLRAIVAAAPRVLVENFSAAIDEAGFTTLAIEIEAIAIVRGLLLDDVIPSENAVAILDLGATRSNVIIFDYGTVQLSISLPISGDAMTAKIAERLKISWNEAENLKLVCGLDPGRCEDRVRPIIEGLLDDLVKQIRTAFRAYRQEHPAGHPIGTVVLAGGTANTIKFDSYLAQKLLVKTHRGDPLRGLVVPKNFPAARSASFTTALGLARRAVRFLPDDASGHADIL